MPSIIDTATKAGGHVSKKRVYLSKSTPHDAILSVVEAKMFPSENPDTEGDEMVVFVFELVQDKLVSIDTNAAGQVDLSYNLSRGKKAALPMRLEEVCDIVAAISGEDVKALHANPGRLRELLADSEAFKGTQVFLSSKAPKDDYYNFCWRTPAQQLAEEEKLAKRAAANAGRKSKASEDDEAEPAPKVATRGRKGKAAESGLD